MGLSRDGERRGAEGRGSRRHAERNRGGCVCGEAYCAGTGLRFAEEPRAPGFANRVGIFPAGWGEVMEWGGSEITLLCERTSTAVGCALISPFQGDD